MSRPLPRPEVLTEPYWSHAAKGIFALPRCEDCARHHFYPRAVCPHCGGARIAWAPASGRGTVYSYSVVHRAPSPAFAEDVPYVVAIVATQEGPHLLTRIVGIAPEEVRIGQRVRARFEPAAEGIALPCFEPEEAGS